MIHRNKHPKKFVGDSALSLIPWTSLPRIGPLLAQFTNKSSIENKKQQNNTPQNKEGIHPHRQHNKANIMQHDRIKQNYAKTKENNKIE